MSGLLLTGGSYFGVERLVPSTLRYRHSLEHSGLKPGNWLSAGRTSKAGGVGRVRATALPAPVLDVGLPVPFVVLHSEGMVESSRVLALFPAWLLPDLTLAFVVFAVLGITVSLSFSVIRGRMRSAVGKVYAMSVGVKRVYSLGYTHPVRQVG